MTVFVARAMMMVAICSLGGSRREWAEAMWFEFDAARDDGRHLPFAIGCLQTAWLEMPKHAEGRAVLANYALALGVLIPTAACQIALAFGLSSVFTGGAVFDGALVPGVSQNPLLAWPQVDAAPCLLLLWLLIGLAHLRLAWALVDRDWERVIKASALMGAAMTTLFIVMAALSLDMTFVILQALVLATEMAALAAAATRHARLSSNDA